MAELEARGYVLVWVEDFYRRAGSKRFWKEEQEQIDLGTSQNKSDCQNGTKHNNLLGAFRFNLKHHQ